MASLSASSGPLKFERRRVSCETLCSSNSSCALQKRKPLHPLAASVRRTSNNPISQRVLSAKLLRFKTLQNQLNDANYHIAQLVSENKLLKNLQKRQDNALSKYEGAGAQLPKVLDSHQEEIRFLEAKNKNLRKTLKDLTDQIKFKDEELQALRDQNKHLLLLCKNKNLEEREKLSDQIEDLSQRLQKSETTVTALNRKLLLETKNYKYKLNSEVSKHKMTQKELEVLMTRFTENGSTIEGRDTSRSKHKASPNGRKSQSVVYLCDNKGNRMIKNPNINKRVSPHIVSSSLTNLSSDVVSCASSTKSQFTGIQEPLSISEKQSFSSKSASDQEVDPSSEAQIKDFINSWQRKNTKLEKDLTEEITKYSSDVISSANLSNKTTDKHTQDYKNAIQESEIIVESLKNNDEKQDKLSNLKMSGDQISFYDYKVMSSKTANDELLSQMLTEDKPSSYSFEEDLLSATITRKLTITEPAVDKEDKKKLLATLKAIDNGNPVVISDVKKPKCELMKELFG